MSNQSKMKKVLLSITIIILAAGPGSLMDPIKEIWEYYFTVDICPCP